MKVRNGYPAHRSASGRNSRLGSEVGGKGEGDLSLQLAHGAQSTDDACCVCVQVSRHKIAADSTVSKFAQFAHLLRFKFGSRTAPDVAPTAQRSGQNRAGVLKLKERYGNSAPLSTDWCAEWQNVLRTVFLEFRCG